MTLTSLTLLLSFLLTASDASYAIIMSKPVDNLNVSGYGIVSNGLPCFLEVSFILS